MQGPEVCSGYLLLHNKVPQDLVVYKNNDTNLSHDFMGSDSPRQFVLFYSDQDLPITRSGASNLLYMAYAGAGMFNMVPSFTYLEFGLKWVETEMWKAMFSFHVRWSQESQTSYPAADFP